MREISLKQFILNVGGVSNTMKVIGCSSATTIQKALRGDPVTVVLNNDGAFVRAYRVSPFPNPNKTKT